MPAFSHVFVIVFENKELDQIINLKVGEVVLETDEDGYITITVMSYKIME